MSCFLVFLVSLLDKNILYLSWFPKKWFLNFTEVTYGMGTSKWKFLSLAFNRLSVFFLFLLRVMALNDVKSVRLRSLDVNRQCSITSGLCNFTPFPEFIRGVSSNQHFGPVIDTPMLLLIFSPCSKTIR